MANREITNSISPEIPPGIPNFPESRRINHRDVSTIRKFSNSHRLPYSDFNFLSICNNNMHQGFRLSVLNESLVVKFLDYSSQDPFYSFIGGYDVEDTIPKLLKQSVDEGLEPKLKLVPEESILLEMDRLKKDYNIVEDLDNNDYIYRIADLMNMKGGDYRHQRNMCSRFIRQVPNPEVRPIFTGKNKNQDIQDVGDIFELLQTWKNQKFNEIKLYSGKEVGIEQKMGIEHEFRAIDRMLNYSKYFDMLNIGLYDGKKLVAFSFNELVDNNFAMLHFKKADTSLYNGAYQYIDCEVAKMLHEKKYKYYNWQQTLGDKGLEESKKKANPIGFVKKYTISPK